MQFTQLQRLWTAPITDMIQLFFSCYMAYDDHGCPDGSKHLGTKTANCIKSHLSYYTIRHIQHLYQSLLELVLFITNYVFPLVSVPIERFCWFQLHMWLPVQMALWIIGSVWSLRAKTRQFPKLIRLKWANLIAEMEMHLVCLLWELCISVYPASYTCPSTAIGQNYLLVYKLQ